MRTERIWVSVAVFVPALLTAAAERPPAAGVIVASFPTDPPPRARFVSARVAALLAEATPKYEPINREPTPNSESVQLRFKTDETSNNTIIRLPTYVVRDRKLPTPDEVDPRQLAHRVMEQYLGPENGFDRGFLNLITSKQIPLLALFGSVSNEARAMARYREDERIRLKADLLELVSLTKRSGDTTGAAKLKREVENAFRRD